MLKTFRQKNNGSRTPKPKESKMKPGHNKLVSIKNTRLSAKEKETVLLGQVNSQKS
jgi:hypothetical protein